MLSVFHKCTFPAILRGVLLILLVALLNACSWFGGGEKLSSDASLLAPLEVPPDLITPKGDPRLARPVLPKVKSATASPVAQTTACQCNEPPRIGERVLPPGKGVQRIREGSLRWLVVEAEPEQVWPLVRKFLSKHGYRVQRDEPAIGMLETDWKPLFADEKDADGKSASDKQANWRESLRVRIEPAEQAGRTSVFVSQRNSQRVAGEETGQWELRPANGDRAVEMLNRLAAYLTAEDVSGVPLKPLKARIDIDRSKRTVIIAEANFENTWRRTSLALQELGFTIEDQDRANRIFHVYNDLPSGLSETELNFGKKKSATVREEYWIHVQDVGEMTHISVRNKAGTVDESQVARHLLNLLLGQIS